MEDFIGIFKVELAFLFLLLVVYRILKKKEAMEKVNIDIVCNILFVYILLSF